MKLGSGKRLGGILAAVAILGTPVIVSAARRSDKRADTDPKTPVLLSSPACPWLTPNLSIATKVDKLIAAMSPLQEATLLHLRQPGPGAPYEGWTPAIPSLCIPTLTEQDGAAGVATGFPGAPPNFPNVTQLPAPIADAAAFDPALAKSYGDVIGAEEAAKGVDMALAPTINIDRSPLWGRSYESLGEDPYLSAVLGVPLVQGIQSNRVVSVLKHYAVYNQETYRETGADNAVVSDRAIHEIYLPAFSAAVQAGKVGSVMCSYNLINGTPACQDRLLLDTTLRSVWNFGGFVRSDCGSVYDQAATIDAGVSQVKCTRFYNPATLAAMVAAGQLPKTQVDALIRPLLTVLFQFDLIAQPHPDNRDDVATTTAHRSVALTTADEGSVLLKNDRSLLPLNMNRVRSLALIGPAEGTPMPAGFGAMHVQASHSVSALTALRGALGDRVHYTTGASVPIAEAVARQNQVAVVVVHDLQAERHDRTSLALPGNQDSLVRAVAAANPNTIVVLQTGSAVLMPWLNAVKAVLETWYPGQEAASSLVDLLSGRVNPSGKLPVTFPASQAAMPAGTAATYGGVGGKVSYTEGINVGYRWYQANQVQPAFSFGYGLSYTKFHFSGMHVAPTKGGGLSVTATITNVGGVAGADVVQCYLGAPASTGEPPRQLRGFTRVNLGPRQSSLVHFQLSPGDLATWDTTQGTWVVDGGTYRVSVGDGSQPSELPLTTTVPVAHAVLGPNSGPAHP
jgi:beta-glucosidase